MSDRRIPVHGDRLPKPNLELASLPEPEAKPDRIESLAAASERTLENLMLLRMNTAANIRKDIALLISELAEQLADAKLAEMLLAQRQRKKANGK